jgi:putative RecB family exonuclease
VSTPYEVGLATFRESFAEAEAKGAGKPWKAGGRATKKFPNKEDKTWWMAEGPTMVHNYYNWRMQNPNLEVWRAPDGTPGIELDMNVTIVGNVIVKGKIDRVFQDKNTGQLIIVDLKTGKPPASGLQLAVYRLALDAQFGVSPDYGAYWMARVGTLDKVWNLNEYPIKMVSRWLRDTKKAIDMGVFIPHTGILCDYCGVRKHCYAFGNNEYIPDFDNDLNGEDK